VTQVQNDYTFLQVETCTAQDTGTIEILMLNRYGCDSVVTISTILTPSETSNISLSACSGENVNFNGIQIAAGTTRQFSYTAANGCDSVVTVIVSALPPVDFGLDVTATCPRHLTYFHWMGVNPRLSRISLA
jgi:hypothetical protein